MEQERMECSYPFTYSFVHAFIYSIMHSFVHLFISVRIGKFIQFFFIYPCIPPIYSFILSVVVYRNPHARGFGMHTMDPQSQDEAEKKRLKMLEHQV